MATETETASRKTFRLDPDVALLLNEAQGRYGTENAAVNGLLREVPKLKGTIAEQEIFHQTQQVKTDEANATARLWKTKFERKADELAEL